jgi:hypothetical protein
LTAGRSKVAKFDERHLLLILPGLEERDIVNLIAAALIVASCVLWPERKSAVNFSDRQIDLPPNQVSESSMRTWPTILVLIISLVLSLSALAWVSLATFGACVSGDLNESYQKTITALDGIADLGLKVSTSLVGIGAALLIGLKTGVSLTGPVRTSLLVSMLSFTQSALYAVWWRFGIANSWLNKCLNLVVEDFMQRRYEMHLIFFLAGLFFLGLLVLFAAFAPRKTSATAEEQT